MLPYPPWTTSLCNKIPTALPTLFVEQKIHQNFSFLSLIKIVFFTWILIRIRIVKKICIRIRVIKKICIWILLGFESMEEYVDNKHPVWCNFMVKFRNFLKKEPLPHAVLADLVRQRWRSGHRIDLNRNLTCFPRNCARPPGIRT